MSKDLIDGQFWTLIEPLIPTPGRRDHQYAGRKPTPDLAVFRGIVFVLQSGIPWNLLPKEMGFGTGAVCLRRLVAWQEAGAWPSIQEALLAELQRRGKTDEARAIAGSLSIRAVLSGNRPVERLRIDASSIANTRLIKGYRCVSGIKG
jgi:transposase